MHKPQVLVKTMSSEKEITAFCQAYMQAFKARKKLAPLQVARPEVFITYTKVRALFQGENIVGGYALNLYPKRSFEALSRSKETELIDRLGQENICEVVAIWKDPALSRTYFRLVIGARIIAETLALGRKYIFGCAFRGHSIKRLYYFLRPQEVWQGSSENDLSVFYFTRSRYIATYLFGILATLAVQMPSKFSGELS